MGVNFLIRPGYKGKEAYHGFGENFKAEKHIGTANVLKVELSNTTDDINLAEGLRHRTPQGFVMIYVCVYFNNKAPLLPPPPFLCSLQIQCSCHKSSLCLEDLHVDCRGKLLCI